MTDEGERMGSDRGVGLDLDAIESRAQYVHATTQGKPYALAEDARLLVAEVRRLREEPERSVIEWAVQYEHGVQICEDEEQARKWRHHLPTPNWVASRTVTWSAWEPVAPAGSSGSSS